LLSPLLMRAPRGDGHPVLTLPGFLASDMSMAPMRRYLKELGYDPYAWKMGRNIGGVSSKRAALRDRLAEIHDATGRKVSIVGWSLGGVYARDLALQAPTAPRRARGVVLSRHSQTDFPASRHIAPCRGPAAPDRAHRRRRGSIRRC